MFRILAFALILVTTSCAGMAPLETGKKEKPRVLSLSPASLGRSLSLSQLVTGEYGDHIYKMRYEVEITPERLALVGLSPLGITLFTLVQEQGEHLIVTQLKEQPVFDPRYTLFDLYLTYWPREALQRALSQASMRLEENTDGTIRRVRGSEGEIIAEITYPPKNLKKGEIIIKHFDIPYRLRIKTLETGGKR